MEENKGNEEEGDNVSADMIESDENDINIYYEPEEIEANKQNQAKDQFADLMQMRQYALDPHRTKMNIMDFIPKQPIIVTPTH